MNWRPAFDALVASRLRTPFKWGAHDCCLFVADCVLVRTGRDPAADLRGTYRTERGGVRALRRLGGLEAAGARCGTEIAPLCAGVCDVGLVNDGLIDVLGVCVGEGWLVPMARGLDLQPLHAARKAWRVA